MIKLLTRKFTQSAISYDGRAVKYFETSLALAALQAILSGNSLLNLVALPSQSSGKLPAFFSNTLQQALNVLPPARFRDKAYAAIGQLIYYNW